MFLPQTSRTGGEGGLVHMRTDTTRLTAHTQFDFAQDTLTLGDDGGHDGTTIDPAA